SPKQYRVALKKRREEEKRRGYGWRGGWREGEEEEEEEEQQQQQEEEEQEEERLLEIERQQLQEEWMLREQKTQEECRTKKAKEEAARSRQEEQESKLEEEWEEPQEKLGREEAAQKRLKRVESERENSSSLQILEPATDLRMMGEERVNCPIYSKTGACRFGDGCSQKHNLPVSSPTLPVRGVFRTFGMEQRPGSARGPHASPERSEEEAHPDVLPKVKNAGKVIQFPSCNMEPHLKANVYVQYLWEECRAALSLSKSGWSAGRQLCEFCPVTRWEMAMCGLRNTAMPKGKHCNFLHAFGYPNNEFGEAIRDLSPDGYGSSFGKSSERRRTGHHHQHHGRPRGKPGLALFCKRNGEAERKRRSRHGGRKSHRHTAKSRERHSSRSRERKRDHSRGRGSGSWSWSRSLSPSGSRSPRGRRSGSRDRTIHTPQSK
uniref:C3H1-type domain-containing protein n=1 Tax=Myotis lucifugus TaxID=59463 RepID=G1PZT7_MYOLU